MRPRVPGIGGSERGESGDSPPHALFIIQRSSFIVSALDNPFVLEYIDD